MPAWRRDKQDILSVINRKLGHSAHPNPERMNAKLTSPSTCTNCWRSRCKPSWHPSWHPPYPQSPSVRPFFRRNCKLRRRRRRRVRGIVCNWQTSLAPSLCCAAVPPSADGDAVRRGEESRHQISSFASFAPSTTTFRIGDLHALLTVVSCRKGGEMEGRRYFWETNT